MHNDARALDRMNSAKKAFDQTWWQTRTVWNDAAQRAFERDHIDPIIKHVEATKAELARMLQAIAQAQRNVP